MKNKAEGAYMTRKNLSTKMRSLENITFIKNEAEFEEMQKIYHELEEQIKLIKSETLDMEYRLSLIEEDLVKKEKKISFYKQKNTAILNDRNNFMKEFFRLNTKIMSIYQTLKVNSLGEIIEIFNKEKFDYQSNYTQFNNLNKENIELNIIYTTYSKDLETLVEKIKTKEQKDNKNIDYNEDIDVVNLEIELRDNKECIEDDIEKIAIKEKILIRMKEDFGIYDKKINYIVNCINFPPSLKFKEKNKKSSNYNIPQIDQADIKNLSTKAIKNLVNLKDSIPVDNDWNENNGN
jgi:hypothetical protein